MASDATRSKILKHLSAQSDSWTGIIAKVSPEVGSQFFTEQALKEMVESGEVVRCADSQYMPGGNVDGKYDDINSKRMHQWPKKGGPYDYQPWKDPFGDKEGQ